MSHFGPGEWEQEGYKRGRIFVIGEEKKAQYNEKEIGIKGRENKPEPAPALETSALTLPIKKEIIPYTTRRKKLGRRREKGKGAIKRKV